MGKKFKHFRPWIWELTKLNFLLSCMLIISACNGGAFSSSESAMASGKTTTSVTEGPVASTEPTSGATSTPPINSNLPPTPKFGAGSAPTAAVPNSPPGIVGSWLWLENEWTWVSSWYLGILAVSATQTPGTYLLSYDLDFTPDQVVCLEASTTAGSEYQGFIYDSTPGDMFIPDDPRPPSYTSATSSNFGTIELPDSGNSQPFQLYLWNGSTFVYTADLAPNTPFYFGAQGITKFKILAVDSSLINGNFISCVSFVGPGTSGDDAWNISLEPTAN
jgi:hypothetical protein